MHFDGKAKKIKSVRLTDEEYLFNTLQGNVYITRQEWLDIIYSLNKGKPYNWMKPYSIHYPCYFEEEYMLLTYDLQAITLSRKGILEFFRVKYENKLAGLPSH